MTADKRLMKSLRRKIMFSYVFALLLLSLLLGFVSICVVDRLADTDSQKILTQICEKEALVFDSKLNQVSNSVDLIYEFAAEQKKLFSADYVYTKAYEEQIEKYALNIANQTDGAMAVYFRYNPEMTGSGTDGFFWSKRIGSNRFEEETVTDILKYNFTDVEHVGWYYLPKEKGKPIWMSPYYNKNIGVFMISYVIPFYQYNGEFIGVIGMDIDFNTIVDEMSRVQVYESGKVALADLNKRLIYYVDDKSKVKCETLSKELYNHVTTINKMDELLEITDEEAGKSVISCKKISNGMVVYLTVPKSEIDKNRNSLIILCIGITVLIFVIAIIYESGHTKKIVYPIERLTETTKKYAQGDWSSHYISDTNDEIQILSESIARMAQNTQEYIEKLNNLARTDAVTGIGNRTGYLEFVDEMKANQDHRFDEYAVAAFDLNSLKKVNDTFGHEAGDLLIKEAAAYMKKHFQNSALFRIGGDEFVAILSGEDYTNCNELFERFAAGMNYALNGNPEIILSISYGMAKRSEELADYESVFECADERMYRKKKEMKQGRIE